MKAKRNGSTFRQSVPKGQRVATAARLNRLGGASKKLALSAVSLGCNRLCFARKQQINSGENERSGRGERFAKDISSRPSICYGQPAPRMDSCRYVHPKKLGASSRPGSHRISTDD